MQVLAGSVLSAAFAVFLVWEKSNNAKHLQMVSGVNPLLFWVSAYLWDMLNFLVPVGIFMVCIIGFGVKSYQGSEFAVLCLLLAFGKPQPLNPKPW